jgi:hypothetical protein
VLRIEGNIADPWGLSPGQWFTQLKAIAEIAKRKHG